MLLSGHSDHAEFTSYTENVKWTSAGKVPPSPTQVRTFIPAARLTSGPLDAMLPVPGWPIAQPLARLGASALSFLSLDGALLRSLSKVGTWQVLFSTVMLCFLYSTFPSLIL